MFVSLNHGSLGSSVSSIVHKLADGALLALNFALRVQPGKLREADGPRLAKVSEGPLSHLIVWESCTRNFTCLVVLVGKEERKARQKSKHSHEESEKAHP